MRKLKGWQKVLLASAGVILPAFLSCSQRSLVLIDVHAPLGVTYANVTVNITPGDQPPTTFNKITFDSTGVFHAGVYIPSGMTGTITLHGEVDENNCVVGSGDTSTNVASEGETTTAVPLPITPATAPCTTGTGGSAGASAKGGAGGAGGMVGAGGVVGSGGSGGLTGTAGAGGVVGACGVVGAGGVIGAGGVVGAGGSTGMGGKGGVTGAGGSNSAGGSTASGGRGGSGAGGVTGAGGVPTTGTGGSTTGTGGLTGSGGIIGKGGAGGLGGGGAAGGPGGVTGTGGLPTTGSGGGGGCICPVGFVCMPGTTTCVCSQTDADACANIACGSTTNACQQTVNCPNTCPLGYSCVGNFCQQLTTTGCGGSIVATGTGLAAGASAAPPICQ